MLKLKRLKGRNISLTHEQIFNKHLKHFENVEVICIFYLEQSCVYNNMKISMAFRLLIFSSVVMLFDWSFRN